MRILVLEGEVVGKENGGVMKKRSVYEWFCFDYNGIFENRYIRS